MGRIGAALRPGSWCRSTSRSSARRCRPRSQIATRDSGYALELEPGLSTPSGSSGCSVSARRLAPTATRRSRLRFADQALALWRGRAFGELAYEDFARAESERLEELRLVGARGATGGAARARPPRPRCSGRRWHSPTSTPYRERAHELAMLALYRCGRQADALEHYAAVRTRSTRSSGLEPGPALRELQRRILQQDPELAASRGRADGGRRPAVPAEPARRSRARARASSDRSSSGATRASSCSPAPAAAGRPGSRSRPRGRSAGSYANGVAFVELAPLRDPALVVPTIAQALDVRGRRRRGRADALADALAPRELLLVVDNAEHVREAAPSFAAARRARAAADGARHQPGRAARVGRARLPRSRRSPRTTPSSSSSSARGSSTVASSSRRRTTRTCARSAAASTACRSRSSSPRRESAR